MKKQIIFIAGVFTPKKGIDNWREILKEKFKGYNIITIGENYSYFKIEGIKKVLKEGLNLVKNKKETILIGHSMGGIIANSILNNTKAENIKQIVTIASPHGINMFGMRKIKRALKYSSSINKKIKLKTFGAYFDPVVPFFLSSLKKSTHKNLPLEHFVLILYSKKTIKKIISYI